MTKKSIHKMLAQSLTLIIIIPFLLLFIVPSIMTYTYFKAHMLDEGRLLITAVEAQMTSFVNQTENEYKLIENNLILTPSKTIIKNDRHFSDFIQNIYRIEILDSKGSITSTLPANENIIGFDRSLSSAYLTASHSNSFGNGKVFFDSSINSPAISWGTRLDNGHTLVCYLTLETINTFFSDIKFDPHTILALIDHNGTYIANSIPESVYSRNVDTHYNDFITRKIPLDGSETVRVEAEDYLPIGKIEPDSNWVFVVYQNKNALFKSFLPYMITYFCMAIILYAITAWILRRGFNRIDCSLTDLRKLTKSISEEEYDIDSYSSEYLELEEIYLHFMTLLNDSMNRIKEIGVLNEDLEERVVERTIALENSIAALKSAQEKIIQEEKISSMVLVATGLTQEMTTPFSIAATLVEHIKTGLKSIEDQPSEEQFSDLYSSLDILERNIAFTTKLLKSFKRISGDQQHELLDIFDLEHLLNDIQVIHLPLFKRHNVDFKIESKNLFRLKSNPSLFEQIFSLLIVNSIEHGFEQRSENKIHIQFQKNNEALTIFYSDNGKGIHEDVHPHVFEPFYTTTRDQGNTGLGLSTLYNIVTKQLSGNIQLSSSQNKGTTFVLTIPLIGEDNKANLYATHNLETL